MRMLTLLLAGLFLPAAVAAPVPKAIKVKDEEAILGAWTVERYDRGPDVMTAGEGLARLRYDFEKDGQVVFSNNGQERPLAYTLDPTATPKAIDLRYPSCTLLGIYELDGDTLTVCTQTSAKDGEKLARPDAMKADVKKNVAVMTLKRVKDEKKDK